MNDRTRFLAHMNYQPVDRCPMWDFGFSDEVLARWRNEGLPTDADLEQLFGMDQQWRDCSVSIGMNPPFKWEVLEDYPDRRVVRRGDGVVQLELKYQQSMPKFLTYPLTDRASWNELRRRLDPTTPDRIPSDWAQRCKRHVDRDYPLLIWAGSIYGWARDWAGDGKLGGYMCYGEVPLSDRCWDLYWIAVDSATQGKGLGREMVRFMEADLGKRHARKIFIETGGKSSYGATRTFYETMGYAETARIPDFFAPGDDKVIFGKDLT